MSLCDTPPTDWYPETLHSDFRQMFKIGKVVHEVKTKHQHLIIFDNETFGRVLALDGVIQLTTKDEFIYTEMMAHVPIFTHGSVDNVLIIGGGDGAILREVTRHQSIKKITMVEIDDYVISLSKIHLPEVSAGAFDDPRVELIICDAADYISTTSDKFDIIICDSTDPFGVGAKLFTSDFYKACRDSMTDRGILVCQSGVPFMQSDELRLISANLRQSFDHVNFYLAPVPTYIGGFMTLSFVSNHDYSDRNKEVIPRQKTADEIVKHFRYYSPEIHRAAFVLPPYIQELISNYSE